MSSLGLVLGNRLIVFRFGRYIFISSTTTDENKRRGCKIP